MPPQNKKKQIIKKEKGDELDDKQRRLLNMHAPPQDYLLGMAAPKKICVKW